MFVGCEFMSFFSASRGVDLGYDVSTAQSMYRKAHTLRMQRSMKNMESPTAFSMKERALSADPVIFIISSSRSRYADSCLEILDVPLTHLFRFSRSRALAGDDDRAFWLFSNKTSCDIFLR